MILHPNTVQLTKIHYYNGEIPTISREIFDNCVNNSHVKIEKNCFRQRWILKINEIQGGRARLQWRLVAVSICVLVAVVFALFFVKQASFVKNQTPTLTLNYTKNLNLGNFTFCHNCTSSEICLKLTEGETPKCCQPVDDKDPTGCGGFCSVDTQFCQLLDAQHRIYQCSNVTNTLKCPQDTFNCGNMCVNLTKRCDGFIHCRDKTDEIKCVCDLGTHFQCGNATSCLPIAKKCNGLVDCWDKSDEIGCQNDCPNGTIPCLNGDCIMKENFCDGTFHCLDRSDEPQGCQLK